MAGCASLLVTVASGKGGTGKTTVAVNLAVALGDVTLLDCDVEEPNAHTLLHPPTFESTPVTVPTPVVDQDSCSHCGACADFCQFNAIFVGKTKTIVYEELCHSCGGCAMVCPTHAISERPRRVGWVHTANIDGIRLVYGELKIGEPVATSVIRAVKAEAGSGDVVVDAPPGTACPVIESIRGSDFVVLVSEPTPFGVHDLSMTVEVISTLGIPYGVIVNRAGIGDDRLHQFCRENDIPVLMEIPFERRIAELYSAGIPFVRGDAEWRRRFREMFEQIREMV